MSSVSCIVGVSRRSQPCNCVPFQFFRHKLDKLNLIGPRCVVCLLVNAHLFGDNIFPGDYSDLAVSVDGMNSCANG